MTHTVPVRPALAGNLSRRRFFGVTAIAGASAVATVATAQSARGATASVPAAGGLSVTSTGSDLSTWQSVLGDALYSAPGQAAVGTADIELVNAGSISTLRANVKRRGVMAHNVTFKREIDASLFDSVHRCNYQFRLPYLPTTSAWPDNAQTIEGGFFIWDGAHTRLDYGMAFQWVLNPWQSDFGALRTWTGSGWQTAGFLTPGTAWHEIAMSFDRRNNVATLAVDNTALATQLTTTAKPSNWGTETAARLQTEIVSLWPGSNQVAPSHRAEVRNWSWTREAYAS